MEITHDEEQRKMTRGMRSDARIAASVFTGLLFTLAMLLLSSGSCAKFVDAIMSGRSSVMRIGLFMIGWVVFAFWTYVGAEWALDDVAEVKGVNSRSSPEQFV